MPVSIKTLLKNDITAAQDVVQGLSLTTETFVICDLAPHLYVDLGWQSVN